MVIEFDPELFILIENKQKFTILLYLCYYRRRYEFFIDVSQIKETAIYLALSKEDQDLINEYFNRYITVN
jgi:hypothetical protein